jgi:hypothetical protein
MDERYTLVCEDSFSMYAIQQMGPKRSLVFLSWTLTFDWYVVCEDQRANNINTHELRRDWTTSSNTENYYAFNSEHKQLG